MFEFVWPWLLLALPLPFLMRFAPVRERHDAALQVPHFNIISQVASTASPQTQRRSKTFILWLIWCLCVTAAADPRWVGAPQAMPYTGRDLMLAVDLSDSMRIKDMQPPSSSAISLHNKPYTRLDAVKHVIGDFVKRRKGDRLGLVLFADKAYLQAPLTYDTATVNQLLQEAQFGFAGHATAIGDAIGLSIKRLRKRPKGSRRLILLTDGQNTAGVTDPIAAAQKAREQGIKIYTIGFGADEQVVQTWAGPRRIDPSRDLDEKSLRKIAQITGGEYFRARSTKELEKINRELDKLEPIKVDEVQIRPEARLFYWPLSIALLLSALLALSSLWQNRTGKQQGQAL